MAEHLDPEQSLCVETASRLSTVPRKLRPNSATLRGIENHPPGQNRPSLRHETKCQMRNQCVQSGVRTGRLTEEKVNTWAF